MVMPPMNCDLAVTGTTMRPAANTPSSRGTRTSPVSASTLTSANWAPNEYRAWSGSAPMASPVDDCADRPPAGIAPSRARICSRSARQASITAQLHEALPIEPPAIMAWGSALSPMRSVTSPAGTPSASAATASSAVRAPVPMSAAAIDDPVVAVGVDAGPSLRGPGAGRVR